MQSTFEKLAGYFFLQSRIEKTKRRIHSMQCEFWSKNFYPSMDDFGDEYRAKKFNLEREVIDHVTGIQKAEKHVAILEFKLKHFTRFLNSLDSESRIYLHARYKQGLTQEDEPLTENNELDERFIEEVEEIEEAASYRFKLEEKELLPKIVFNPFEESATFEDSFAAMVNLLGV